MLPLGTTAPDFDLPDTEGKHYALRNYTHRKGLLVMFICNHCPYVKHIRQNLADVTATYMDKGIAIVAINSNDVVKYPDDSPEKMKLEKKSAGYHFPYLFDESQKVAKAFQAACTPDFYLFDHDLKLVYRGQYDESRPGNGIAVTGRDLTLAMDAVIAGKPVARDQRPSIGCNIKWK